MQGWVPCQLVVVPLRLHVGVGLRVDQPGKGYTPRPAIDSRCICQSQGTRRERPAVPCWRPRALVVLLHKEPWWEPGAGLAEPTEPPRCQACLIAEQVESVHGCPGC